jgi:protein gp37
LSASSAIEWTDATWNPLRGCTKISPGCKHCYAETFAERFRGVPGHPYEHGFDFRLVPEALDLPLSWKKPRFVFVNSMSDLFHDRVPVEYIEQVFSVMRRAPQHVFQVLTKRSERLRELAPRLTWSSNVWIGVSVESERYLSRVADLVTVERAAIRFLSIEPLLGPIPCLPLNGIDWVIVGGESGPGARPLAEEWACSIRDQCVRYKVPFFFKQWGGVNKKASGRKLQGELWNQRPEPAKVSCEPRELSLFGPQHNPPPN